MNIPTTQELSRKTKRELQKIFQQVAAIAASENCTDHDRHAAKKTLENVRRCLVAKAPRL